MKKLYYVLMLFSFSLTFAQNGYEKNSSILKTQTILDGYDWASLGKGESTKLYVTINNMAPSVPILMIYYRYTLIQKPDSINYHIDKVYKESYKIYGTNLTLYRYCVDLTVTASKNAMPGFYLIGLSKAHF